MTSPTARVVATGRALAGALRAFETLEPQAGWFERQLIRLLRATYRQRLRYLVATLPPAVSEEFLREKENGPA